jgi:hypothetical protein
MKLCGVEIPSDIEIPPLDAATKAELDELHESIAHKYEKLNARHLPSTVKPQTFSIEVLRKLPPWSRTRVLYLFRDQVTD